MTGGSQSRASGPGRRTVCGADHHDSAGRAPRPGHGRRGGPGHKPCPRRPAAAAGSGRGEPSAALGLTKPNLKPGRHRLVRPRPRRKQASSRWSTRSTSAPGRGDRARSGRRSGRMSVTGTVPRRPNATPTDCSTVRPGRGTCSGWAGLKHQTPPRSPGAFIRANTWLAARRCPGDPAVPGPGRVRVVGADRAGHRAGPLPPLFWRSRGPWPGAGRVPSTSRTASAAGPCSTGVRVGPGGHRGCGGPRRLGHPNETPPLAVAAITLHAGVNRVRPGPSRHLLVPQRRASRADVVLAGDAFDDRDMAFLTPSFLEEG